MKKAAKIFMFVAIVVIAFAPLIPAASAFHVHGGEILGDTVAGNKVVDFEIKITDVPRVYGVKITTDLVDPSLLPENIESYESEGDILLVHPPATEFTVKISGRTPLSSYKESYEYLEFTRLNEEQYLYYHVFITDRDGTTQEGFKKPKKAFKLEKPDFYREVEKGVAEIKNEELRGVAESLLDAGLVEPAEKLTDVSMGSHHIAWYKAWWYVWLIIGLVVGICMVLICMKLFKKEDDEKGVLGDE